MDDASVADVVRRAAEHVVTYRASLADRPVVAAATRAEVAAALGAGPLGARGVPAAQVLDELVRAVEPGLVATAGPRYFGFVVGGTLPSALAADVVTSGWDQNAYAVALSPAAVAAEDVAGSWVKELLGLPTSASVGFATGAQGANTIGLLTGRDHVLAQAGWDVAVRGLTGAPNVSVVAGAERHATIDRSLRLLGLGTASVREVRAQDDGAVDVADLARVLASIDGPVIVCLQAGNVNTGACDDLRAGSELAHERGAWVHVDGAFGLWAAASPAHRHLVTGADLADSWSCDGHKWLNLPHDVAFAICAHPDAHVTAASYRAAYLTGAGEGAPAGGDLVVESSRRARGFAAWAALRELGRDGVAELVERCCRLARQAADALRAGGVDVPNEVVLNQVLGDVGDGDAARTDRIVEAIQAEGTCWLGATTWHGRRLMRFSVSGASTTEADIAASAEAILRVRAATP